MEKATRLNKMADLLEDGREPDIAKLAKTFKVSESTIKRDLSTIANQTRENNNSSADLNRPPPVSQSSQTSPVESPDVSGDDTPPRPPDTPDSIPVDQEAAALLEASFRLGAAGEAVEYHSYSSLLVACMLAENPASRWFRRRLAELQVEVTNQKTNLALAHLSDDELIDLAAGRSSIKLKRKTLDWTMSATGWIGKAADFARRHNPSNIREVSARDLIAAFVFQCNFHSADREKMGLGPAHDQAEGRGVELANGFLSFIFEQHRAEYDIWTEIFRDEFKVEPKPDILQGPATRLSSDRWTIIDRLGYMGYARAIRHFLLHPRTRPPMSISIQAPWGAGKTSLMRMIQSELDPEAVDAALVGGWSEYLGGTVGMLQSRVNLGRFLKIIQGKERAKSKFQGKHPERYTVWFNAWKYESGDQLWAGLATAIIDQISTRMEPLHREEFLLRLQAARIDPAKIRRHIYELAFNNTLTGMRNAWLWVRSALPLVLGGILQGEANLEGALSAGAIGSLLWAASETFKLYNKENEKAKNEPVSTSLADVVSVPDYDSEIGFTHRVVEDLQHIFKALKDSTPPSKETEDGMPPIVVFIDDLDRCSPRKVADVIEGVNMFLAGDFMPCIFVIGMDPQMVSAALEKAHKDIIGQLPRYDRKTPLGWRFMDKFVQLPFTIPPPDANRLTEFRNYLLYGTEVEAVVAEGEQMARDSQEVISSGNDAKAAALRVASEVGKGKQLEQAKIEAAADVLRSTFALRLQDKMSENFSDSHPLVQDMLSEAAKEYSNNPRDIKRLLNVVRFQYFISRFRLANDLGIPDPDIMGRWVALSLRWPAFVRWLQWSPPLVDVELKPDIENQPELLSEIVCNRLKTLERLSREKIPFEKWREKVRQELHLSEGDVQWDSDPVLRAFLGDKKAKPLSEGAGLGFY